MSTDTEAARLIELLATVSAAVEVANETSGEGRSKIVRVMREAEGEIEDILREARESTDAERLTHLGEVASKSSSVHLLDALEKNPHTPEAVLERLRVESGRSGA